MTRRLSPQNLVSMFALAVGLAATQTHAAPKGLLGNFVVNVGDVVISEGTDVTNILVNSTSAVIDWTPDDNIISNGVPITFLASNGTANFQGFSDFAVLNRIQVADNSRQILLNGAINSTIGQTPGGRIFFYSPSGFLVGLNARINVGSLVLSASPIAVDGNGGFITGGTVAFNQAPNPAAAITTQLGSQINAYGSGGYVALVAPQIVHSGTIRTDGAAALVAAEAGTITFSPDGLYNIQVTNGTDAATGIDIDGGTIGRNDPTEGVGNRYAYLVAVARNDAVDMLIRNGGSVGFDTATSAAVEDNVVVLSGGRQVTNGSAFVPAGTSTVNLRIDQATLSSDTFANVSGGATITTSTGSTAFGGNLTLYAEADSFIQAINGNRLSIGGSLSVILDKQGSGLQTTGNLLRLSANGSSALTIGGTALLSARSYGAGDSGNGTNAGNATGGTIIVQTGSGSTIDITGGLDINVDGYGGSHGALNGAAGNGTGGTAHILANGGAGSALTVGGATNVSAIGIGGSPIESTGAQITGGSGRGGTILVQAATGSGNQLNLNNVVNLIATGEGGAGDVVGGIGTGGTIQFQSSDSGLIAVAGNLTVEATGQGGFGLNNGVSGGTGGAATGGNVSTLFNGAASAIDFNGISNFSANASGGNGVNGGAATGGWVNLQASNGGTLTAAFLGGSANASGGSGNIGGTALGGRAWVQAITGGDIIIDDLSLRAEGSAGTSTSGNGASGTGGYVIASASNATLTVNATLDLEADGSGGFASAASRTGGTGRGGQADVFADNGGTVTLNGTVALDANGQGGNYNDDLSRGGNGAGGLVYFQASNGATLDAAMNVTLTANGSGGFSFADCSFCGGTGGNGTGGTVTVQTYGGAGTRINVGGMLSLSAGGLGRFGFAGAGGNGLGGAAQVYINESGTLDVASDLIVTADGQGGSQNNGGLAGNGTGGTADVAVGTGSGSLTVGGTGILSAGGLGGNASGSGSIGGNGRGGFARILASGGTSSFLSDVLIGAEGIGGGGIDGTGGAGTAGDARMIANGGSISVGADLTVAAISTGGTGNAGGDAITFVGANPRVTATSAARVVALRGSISVAGATLIDASAQGGDGANGGAGGDASAGFAAIHATNSNLGPSSVTVGGLTIAANGFGGVGGRGTPGNPSGDGGTGGSAIGGVVVVTGSAGNGTLTAGDVVASASAFGGDGGGGGGNGDGSFGGDGGNGGSATGGSMTVGTESGIAEAIGANNGSGSFATITALASATGGNGGNSGFGSIQAGDGGAALGGRSNLIARGSPVTVGTVLLDASATGGDGGFDGGQNFAGIGGNATSGQVGVLVSNRFNFLTQRGSLNAGDIIGFADAVGGNGTTGGTAGSSGGLLFSVLNSGATVASVNLSSSADFFAPASPLAGPSAIQVRNGNVVIAGEFSVVSPGAISIWADGGGLSAAAITVSADNYIHDPALPAPVAPGTYSAGAISLTTGQNLIVDAHLSTPASIILNAPGLVQVLNVTSGGGVFGNAGNDFIAQDIVATNEIDLLAGRDIRLGNLVAGISQFGTDAIFLDAIGAIQMGNAVARGSIDFTAGTTVTGLNLTSGLGIGGDANDAIVLGNLSAGLINSQGPTNDGFSIGIASATSIRVGNAAGAEAVGFATFGALTTGNISAGTDVLAMVSGNMIFGSITSGVNGRTYLADSSMFIAAGGVDNFNPALVFGRNPVATIGSISITGPVSTGSFQAAAGSNFSAGNIVATNGIEIIAGGNIVLANLLAGNSTFAFNPNAVSLDAGGSILMGNATARGIIDFSAGTTMTGVNLTSGVKIGGEAGGAILLGNLSGGLVNPQGPSDDGFSVGIGSGASIGTGTVAGAQSVGFFTPGSLTTGNVSAGANLLALTGGNMGFGSITTGAAGRTYLAGYAMVAAAGGTDNFNPALVFASTNPIATTGSVTIGGATNTGRLDAFAGGNFTSGPITAGAINVRAGGLAALNGLWLSNDVELWSNDIDIAATAGIDAGTAGDIILVSTNATQALIGDGLTGTGYALSNAEFGRLSGGSLTIAARGDASAAIDMLIGNLNITGPLAGSTIESPTGRVLFFTGNPAQQSPGGVIRITGNVAATGFQPGNVLEFVTGRFELDADTGSVLVEQSAGVLGGIIDITADRIHIASGAVLQKLIDNPLYDGRENELATPIAVARPNGVIAADTIYVSPTQAVLVQNTGTAQLRAGFRAGYAELFPPQGAAPGSIELIVNGQLVTEGGTLTGVDARDALVDVLDIAVYSANSSINGCPLTGSCSSIFPPGFTPTPGIQDEIVLIKRDLLPPPEFGNEDFIDDNDEQTEDGATSPIQPPQPLFDTSALGGEGDVDDPVSGSGNPALMETPPPATNKEQQP